MTREEAIEILHFQTFVVDFQTGKALEMAISALRQQEQERKAATGEGLRCKYIVRKADTGEGVDGCFVLRPDRDRAAVAALRAYAAATDNDVLVTDILNWVGQESNAPLTMDELREAAQTGDPVWLVRTNCSSWVVIEKVDDRKYIQLVDYAEFGSDEPYDFAISDYGDSFKAYRQKPEEDDHE